MTQADYLERIVDEVWGAFGETLVGVYLFGSAAYGAAEPGTSDLDVQAVVSRRPTPEACLALAQALSHSRLPCPARRLEFVLHESAGVAPAQRRPPWLMNLNTGSDTADVVSLDPASESSHWFLLDIAIGTRLGVALCGPPPDSVFAPIPRAWQLDAIAESLAWHRTHQGGSANAVLNACRGWRYADTGVHGSKRAGALWVRRNPRWRLLVDAALRGRRAGGTFDPAAVAAFIEHAEHHVRLAATVDA